VKSSARAILGLVIVAWTAVAPSPSAAAPPKAKALVDAWIKAKKDDERAAAWKAIEENPSLAPEDVAPIRDALMQHFAKRARKVDGDDWFDEKKDGWRGRHMVSGKGDKGLVLAMHGGGAGSGDCGQAQGSFAGAISNLGMRGVYPEVLKKTEYGWTDPPETEKWVMTLVRSARLKWGIDPNRVYLTGHSMGGYGTWTYGSIYADLFAAGAAFAGAPTMYWKPGGKDKAAEAVTEGYLPNLRNLPLFVYQSLDDPNVPSAANVFAMGEMKKLHEAEPKGWEFVYEEVNGRKHDFPAKGPGPGLEWAASHVRNPRPERIVWQPTRPWKTTFYWLRWSDPWLGAEVVADADRAKNAIAISVKSPRTATPTATEAERPARIAKLSVYLDDRLVDLSKEVVVTVDGKERFRGVPRLSLVTLVRSADEREDPEYTFPAESVWAEQVATK
jgi:pimeloyl-ACP methyl ester carboxylesterase